MSSQHHLSTRSHASERALTVVEMMVAGVIGVILLSLAIIAFTGSKSTTYHKENVTTGSAYAQAVAQYQGDHANRHPELSGANTDAVKKGPLNLLGKPYMSTPDAVAGGRVGVSFDTDCGTTAAAPSGASDSHRGWVSVCFEAEPSYGVRVLTRAPDNQWTGPDAKLCWLGSTAREPRC